MVTTGVAALSGEIASDRADAAFPDPGTMRDLKVKGPTLERELRVLNTEDKLLRPVGLACAVRPKDTRVLNFLNAFIRDFVRSGEGEALRDKCFDPMAQR